MAPTVPKLRASGYNLNRVALIYNNNNDPIE